MTRRPDFPRRIRAVLCLAVAVLCAVRQAGFSGETAWEESPRQARLGLASIAQPYPYLHGGDFTDPAVPESPDPLVSYRWEETSASDGLQVYFLEPASVRTDPPQSFRNAESLTGENPRVDVVGTGSIRLDFGVVSAAWLEMDSPDLSGDVEMSISEYNEPAVVNFGPPNPVKTRKPEKYGNVYRLELNNLLYEGVRFGWIHVRSFSRPWTITGIRLICQIKPANYNGRFSSADPLLTRIWYTGAYVVKLNQLKDQFGAILMDRGDRHSWTGDAYPSQAAALAAFANYDFVKMNLERTADDDNGIESYSLYWILSVVDYYRYTGDHATINRFIPNIQGKLDRAQAIYDNLPNLVFFGWDERLGAGFENPNTEESRRAYRMVFIRACLEFAWAMDQAGRPDLARHYEEMARDRMEGFRNRPRWHEDFGLHAGADAVNTGLLNSEEQREIFEREFTGPVHHMSYSPFNQYFVIQALARMNRHDEALDLIRAYWGGQIDLGATTYFEVYRPDWNTVLGRNDPVPNNQCGYTSLAHPWGAGVTKWLTEEILGIKPVEPGFSRYSILPRLGSGATALEGRVSTPHGEIRVSYNLSTGRGRILSPPGTTGRIGIPKAGKQITSILVDGEVIWEGEEDGDYVYFDSVKPGQYEFSVAYTGSSAAVNNPISFPAKLIGLDSTTQGNWGGVYGKDGHILCNYHGTGMDVRNLPSYVSFVTEGKTRHAQWSDKTYDPRAPAPDPSNEFPRKVGCYHTGDPIATYQTMTVDIGLTHEREFQVALYFIDWDGAGRRSAVEAFDYQTKKLVSPLAVVSHYQNGVYLVYSYTKSLRLRINQIRGPNAVLSGIFFDSSPGTGLIHGNR
ncbi:MAG: alpha-L-rhamnosidase C-terminal domain-containing protein [Acidobacteriota bacterium]|nr:alpha-L-rhamnosidase C-terminal domain-containing protein [Acidobacteriota bacterium]